MAVKKRNYFIWSPQGLKLSLNKLHGIVGFMNQ